MWKKIYLQSVLYLDDGWLLGSLSTTGGGGGGGGTATGFSKIYLIVSSLYIIN